MKAPIVVLGGGVAGLASGYYLARAGFPVTVVERNPVVGGLCGTFDVDGFALDHGPHKLYSVVPGVLDEIRRIMDGRLIEHVQLMGDDAIGSGNFGKHVHVDIGRVNLRPGFCEG